MNIETDFFTLTETTYGAVFSAYLKHRPPPPSGQQPPDLLRFRRGYAESPAWYLVQAMEFAPEPLPVEKLRKRDIYAAPSQVKGLLEMMASEGWLDRKGESYHLLDKGHQVISIYLNSGIKIAAVLNGKLNSDLTRLEALARRTIDACSESDDPPGIWCLVHSRRRAPVDDATPLARLIGYFNDYNAFRDDCHMASYREHKIEGYAWEAFSFVRDGKARSVEELFEALHYRGYSREDFTHALDDLQLRGWISDKGKHTFKVTAEGEALRAQADELTNAYYYRHWDCLNRSEVEEFRQLLEALKQESEKLAAD